MVHHTHLKSRLSLVTRHYDAPLSTCSIALATVAALRTHVDTADQRWYTIGNYLFTITKCICTRAVCRPCQIVGVEMSRDQSEACS